MILFSSLYCFFILKLCNLCRLSGTSQCSRWHTRHTSRWLRAPASLWLEISNGASAHCFHRAGPTTAPLCAPIFKFILLLIFLQNLFCFFFFSASDMYEYVLYTYRSTSSTTRAFTLLTSISRRFSSHMTNRTVRHLFLKLVINSKHFFVKLATVVGGLYDNHKLTAYNDKTHKSICQTIKTYFFFHFFPTIYIIFYNMSYKNNNKSFNY